MGLDPSNIHCSYSVFFILGIQINGTIYDLTVEYWLPYKDVKNDDKRKCKIWILVSWWHLLLENIFAINFGFPLFHFYSIMQYSCLNNLKKWQFWECTVRGKLGDPFRTWTKCNTLEPFFISQLCKPNL